jgi:hypothetical protein
MSNSKEVWKPVSLPVKRHTVQYLISNQGRLAVKNPDGSLEVRKFKPTGGIYRYNIRLKGKSSSIFLTKEVAKAFVKKPSSKHTFIIHKDHDYLNDRAENLRWATREEHREHTTMSPRSVEARNRKAIIRSSHSRVLNEKSAVALKKMIWDPERKLSYSQLAQKFGVSEMQIYRIKNGLFWYHVRVPNEPMHARYKKNLQNIEFHQRRTEREKQQNEKRRALKDTKFRKTDRKNTEGASEKLKRKSELKSNKTKSQRNAASKIAFKRKPPARAAKRSKTPPSDSSLSSRITSNRKSSGKPASKK